MASIMELLAKADDIIKAQPIAVPKEKPTIKVPETFAEYREKVNELHKDVDTKDTTVARLQFADYLTQPHMLEIATIPWLLTWSASLRWSMINKGDKVHNLYGKYYNTMQDYINKRSIQIDKIISDLKWLEEFIEKNKQFADFYHYETIRYLSAKMTSDIWTSLSETDRKYITEFVGKMDATKPDLKTNVEEFLGLYK